MAIKCWLLCRWLGIMMIRYGKDGKKQMKNEMEIYEGTVVENDVDRKKWIWILVCAMIALVSFFGVSKWATSVDTYSGVIETLNDLQKQALGMTGTSTAFATAAAAIPGDATTPVANKLADLAGYMVIVYVAILIEKYLLTLTGFLAFKICLPIGCMLAAAGRLFRTQWRGFLYRVAAKCVILGLLLWCLVPASAWVSNWINDTYENSYNINTELVEESKKAVEDSLKNAEESSESEAKEEENGFSISNMLSNFADKVNDAAQSAGQIATDKIEEFQDALNQMIEGVAVMIVTTCVVPILVLMAFMGVLKFVTGLNLPTPSVQSMSRASKLIKKRKKNDIQTIEK